MLPVQVSSAASPASRTAPLTPGSVGFSGMTPSVASPGGAALAHQRAQEVRPPAAQHGLCCTTCLDARSAWAALSSPEPARPKQLLLLTCNPGASPAFTADFTGCHLKPGHCSPAQRLLVTMLQAEVDALYQAASVEMAAQYEKMVRQHEAEEAAAAALLQGLIADARAAQRKAEAVAERHIKAIHDIKIKLHPGCSQWRPAGKPAWKV